MNVILYGPPGAGKGTQASKIVHSLGYVQLSTGDLIRQEIKSKSELGNRVKKVIDAGELVDSETMNQLVSNFLEQHMQAQGIIFDGYPRTSDQAVFLDHLLAHQNREIGAVISLNIDDNQITKRILGRLICEDCGESYHEEFNPPMDGQCKVCGGKKIAKRSDDTEETIKIRLETYYKETFPLLEYYMAKDRVVEIDGMQSPDDVFQDIKEALSKKVT